MTVVPSLRYIFSQHLLFVSSSFPQVLSQGGLGPTLSWSLADGASSLGAPSYKGGYSITTYKYRARYKDFGKRLTCAISSHRYWNTSGKGELACICM